MSKILRIIRIILITAFGAAIVLLIINTTRIIKAQTQIESVLGEDVEYFNDEKFFDDETPLFQRQFYKYKDQENAEYWVNTKSSEFQFMINPSIVPNQNTTSESKARDIAYQEAQKWDADFFAYDTMCETTSNPEYEFIIFQVDEMGYKTGKFIVANVIGNQMEYLSMHIQSDSRTPNHGSVMGEIEAIDIAYLATENTEFMLSSQNNHLVKTAFYLKDGVWVWDITIWKATQSDIISQSSAIDIENCFSCQIDANSQAVLQVQWIQTAANIVH